MQRGAARGGHLRTVRRLFEVRASLDACLTLDTDLLRRCDETADVRGTSPLTITAMEKPHFVLTVIELLLELGARVTDDAGRRASELYYGHSSQRRIERWERARDSATE